MTRRSRHDLTLSVGPSGISQLSDEEKKEIIFWLGSQVETAPARFRRWLDAILKQLLSGHQSHKKYRANSRELGRALGLIPSSERRKSGDPLAGVPSGKGRRHATERERLQYQLDRSHTLVGRYGDLRKRYQDKAQKLEGKLAKLTEDPSNLAQEELMEPSIDKIELSDEAKAESAESASATVLRLQGGDGEDPSMRSSTETLMNTSLVSAEDAYIDLPVDLPSEITEDQVVETLVDSRERFDFSLNVTRVHLDVEKKIVEMADGERRVFSASTTEIGPPRYSVTWGALATLAVMVGQFAMPLNRIAKMLTTAAKKFTAAGLSRMVHYIAERFGPIYLELANQLTDCDILSGDDTSCRVLEVSSYFSKPPKERQSPPWESYRTVEDAEKSYKESMIAREEALKRRQDGDREAQRKQLPGPSLSVLIGRRLGFQSKKRDGSSEKEALHTTVITGRVDDDIPESMIVFYRSHIGSFGNLLEMLLKKRNPDAKNLVVQADLSSTNFVTDLELLKRFNIELVGCTAHARRPFAQFEDDDPTNAAYMLHLFRGIALHEHLLDCHGRNSENVLAVRDNDSRDIWNEIKHLAKKIAKRWSKATPLGTGARYILKHFEKLTAYLRNPRLEPTNNMRERLLRTEKLIEKSSLFRRTIEGRVVLDILRTILQTAVAAEVPVQDYLVDVMKADPDDIAKNPQDYTPRAWAMRRAADVAA